MLFLPDCAGPHDPVEGPPERRPGSVRRTSTVDSTRPDGLGTGVVLEARGRDLATDRAGGAHVEATLEAHAGIDALRCVEWIESDPAAAGLAELVGASVAGGLRARIAASLPAEAAARSLLNLVLDDLPGASLVSGYSLARAGVALPSSPLVQQHILGNANVCAGWRSDGSMMVAFREKGELATPLGPPAPDLAGSDPDAWHTLPTLGPHATRRRRRLDLWPADDEAGVEAGSGTHRFDAHFRDSHVDEDGTETVVHEYVVAGAVDAATRTFTALRSEARVLPWVECPEALDSAERLVGTPIGDLRTRIRAEFSGITTCTHLNDTLRTLADLDTLLDRLP